MLGGQLTPQDIIHYYSNLYQNTISYGVDLTRYYPKLDERSKYIEI